MSMNVCACVCASVCMCVQVCARVCKCVCKCVHVCAHTIVCMAIGSTNTCRMKIKPLHRRLHAHKHTSRALHEDKLQIHALLDARGFCAL